MVELTTSRLAVAAGVNPQTLRYYERRGLLPEPVRTTGNHRRFGPADVERVRFIKRAQAMGFSLGEVSELLALRASATADCSEVRARAQTHLAEVDSKIKKLRVIRARLRELIDGCPGEGALDTCPILRAFEE